MYVTGFTNLGEATLLARTEKAGLFLLHQVEGEHKTWFPWRHVNPEWQAAKKDDRGQLEVSKWLANQKGLAVQSSSTVTPPKPKKGWVRREYEITSICPAENMVSVWLVHEDGKFKVTTENLRFVGVATVLFYECHEDENGRVNEKLNRSKTCTKAVGIEVAEGELRACEECANFLGLDKWDCSMKYWEGVAGGLDHA